MLRDAISFVSVKRLNIFILFYQLIRFVKRSTLNVYRIADTHWDFLLIRNSLHATNCGRQSSPPNSDYRYG